MGCGCKGHDPWKSVWTGVWPGVTECRALGWYAKLGNFELGEHGFKTCDANDEGAVEDLNRWVVFYMTGTDPKA